MSDLTSQAITLTGIFSKATTTSDGGWNLTLTFDNTQAQEIIKVAELKDRLLQLAIIPIPEL